MGDKICHFMTELKHVKHENEEPLVDVVIVKNVELSFSRRTFFVVDFIEVSI